MKQRLVVFGAGQNATVAFSYLTWDSDYEVVAFTVDREYLNDPYLLDRPVVPFDEVVDRYPPDQNQMLVFASYRDLNGFRERKYHEAKEKGYRLATYVSRRATVFPGTKVGENCFLMDNVTIQPFATIGNNVVCWPGAVIGHNTSVADHCFLAAHSVLGGSVVAQTRCFFGLNSVVASDVTVRRDTLVGAGSVIHRSTPERGVYMVRSTPLFLKKSDELGSMMPNSLFTAGAPHASSSHRDR